MTFESIVAVIDTALTGWDEFDNDFYINELVESGGFHCSYCYPIFVVARLTAAITDRQDLAEQLTHAHQLEEDLAWFVDSLRHRQNLGVWRELLKQVRIQVNEAADEVKDTGHDEDPGNLDKMDLVSSREAQVEDKAASTSVAEGNFQKEEDEPAVKRMRFSANAEIGGSRMKEDGSGEDRIIVEKQGQNDRDNEEPAIKKMCLSSEQPNTRFFDNVVNGTEGIMADDRKGEADTNFRKEVEELDLKNMKLSDKETSTGIVSRDEDNIIDVWNEDITFMADDRDGEADSDSGKEIEEPVLKKMKLSDKEPNTGICRGDEDNIIVVWNKDVTFMKGPELGIGTRRVDFYTNVAGFPQILFAGAGQDL